MGEQLVTHRIFPATITAGLNLTFRAAVPDFPPPGWELIAHLRGPKAIDLEATADGSAHLFDVKAAATQAWPAGTYAYSVRATNGGDVIEVEAGQVVVRADLAGIGDGHDARSHVEKVLEAIEAVIEGRATRDQERYEIDVGGTRRELVRTPIPDLLRLRDRYREELRRMNAAARGHSSLLGRPVRVRFT